MLRMVDKKAVTQWIDMLFLITAAILQVKINMIWAASRMFRKLKNPVRERVGRNLNEIDVDKRFAELVLTYCKGRNHLYSRMLHGIFQLFLILSTTWSFFLGDLLFADSYLALVLPMMTGSLAVVGTRLLKWYEVGSIFLASFVYGGLMLLSSTGVFRISAEMRGIAFWVDISLIAVFILDLIFDMYGDYHRTHADLFCTAQAIIKGDMNEKQKARFKEMEKFVYNRKSGKGLDKRIRIWNIRRRRVVVDIFLYFVICAATVISFRNEGQDFNMARIVGVEIFEMISVFLLFLDDSLVEPTLYMALLEHAHDVDENPNRQFMQLDTFCRDLQCP